MNCRGGIRATRRDRWPSRWPSSTIPLVVILLFLAALGRFSDARNQVDEAARDAAREASTYLTPAVATPRPTRWPTPS